MTDLLQKFRAALAAMERLDDEASDLCDEANATGHENAEGEVREQADEHARIAARLAVQLLGGGTERYGYVDYNTPDRTTAESNAGRWRFLLDDTVTNFAEAWEAAVDDFCADPEPWRDAKVTGRVFNAADIVAYPHILARHGLIYLPDDPTAPSVLVDLDDIVVDPRENEGRCLHTVDGEYCGVWTEIDADGQYGDPRPCSSEHTAPNDND